MFHIHIKGQTLHLHHADGEFRVGRIKGFKPGQVTRLFSMAITTASVRLEAPNLERMLLT
jgi:hypothetical protein